MKISLTYSSKKFCCGPITDPGRQILSRINEINIMKWTQIFNISIIAPWGISNNMPLSAHGCADEAMGAQLNNTEDNLNSTEHHYTSNEDKCTEHA